MHALLAGGEFRQPLSGPADGQIDAVFREHQPHVGERPMGAQAVLRRDGELVIQAVGEELIPILIHRIAVAVDQHGSLPAIQLSITRILERMGVFFSPRL